MPPSRGAIARTFWGKGWCDNLERYSDFANRLPRGRTYVRNGSVIDLQIGSGKVHAKVVGSTLYDVDVTVAAVPAKQWQVISADCAGSIDSMVELPQGRLSNAVMERVLTKAPAAKTGTTASRIGKARLAAMIEEATADAYGEAEEAVGWYTVIEENLALPFESTVLGVAVKVAGLDILRDNTIVAVCTRGRTRQSVPMLDLALPSPRPAGAEWIEAYRKWAGS